MSWLLEREWVAPILVLALVFALLLRLDQEQRNELQNRQREAAPVAERRASRLSDEIGNAVATRIGAL